MRTSAGVQVNTVFGVASMLINILKKEEPDALLFCFDEGEETFRHTEYKDYKAGRAETPDDFYDQIPHAFAFIDAFGAKRVSLKSHEADDLLCAYAKAVVNEGGRVTIITGDRDAFQLASDKVKIAVPSKGYREPEYFGPREVESVFGVTPAQIPSYKGLVGDSSDNLPGVHGIGPKAAAVLLQQYVTLEALYEHIDDVPAKWRDKLIAGRDSAFMCKRMAELVCDFPLPISLQDIELGMTSLTPALAKCREFEFSLVTKRLKEFAMSSYGRRHFSLEEGDTTIASGRAPSESPQLSLL